MLNVKRIGPIIAPDRSRVMIRPYYPVRNETAQRIIDRVMKLSEEEAVDLYITMVDGFSDRHENLSEIFQRRFLHIRHDLNPPYDLSPERQMLIGSYFLMEYSPEAAALFNPSIVPHPDQSGLPPGALRFILSLRATGEGHISSITFRVGIVSAQHRITLSTPVPFTLQALRNSSTGYEKALFFRKLNEAGLQGEIGTRIMDQLPDVFILDELKDVLDIERQRMAGGDTLIERALTGILLLAESNYEVRFDRESKVSQRILFPSSPSQSNGIEDARFVRFREDDGSFRYYATYTAYDGKITLPQLLETSDFVNFKFLTLNGPAVQNKGMALFPRKINGQYAMLSRQDDENILLMYSDNIHFWQTPRVILEPVQSWEFMKIGTCGSPIETEKGWLVLSHGVGALRKYSIGVFLLDLEDPSIVIGRLKDPLIVPNEAEREGYVPNVVYTCGALLQGRELVIPYAMSDYASSFATVSLDDIFSAMDIP